MTTSCLLKVSNITKSFPGVQALKGVDMECQAGTIHALVGENGAGKSTLLKILSGLQCSDSGEIYLRGQKVRFKNPEQAEKMGIAMVYQELTLLPEISVAQNIFLQNEPRKLGLLIDEKKLRRQAADLLHRYGLDSIDPDAPVSSLSAANQQMVEIIKAIRKQPQILILDEPTSSLAGEDTQKLFAMMRNLRSDGKLVIFISHRLEEIFEITDQITIFKDGELVCSLPTKDLNENRLIELMVGRPLQSVFPPKAKQRSNKVVFSVQKLNVPGKVHGADLQIRQGEIVGIAGLQGHGQTELLCALAGLTYHTGQSITLDGQPCQYHNASQAISRGITLVPEDRKYSGLCLQLSVRENLTAASLGLRSKAGLVDRRAENRFIDESIKMLSIKTPSSDQIVNHLSGGNQQKVVLGKCLAIHPRVLLFDEPTRGIDVSAKQQFYQIMRQLADSGIAVVLHSSDMLECIGMCDRVLVMYEGRMVSQLEGDDITESNIMRSAMGMEKEDQKQ